MSPVRRALLVSCALLAVARAHAEVELDLDLRLVESNGRKSFLDGGLGKLRFDSHDDGVQLGRARLGWRASPGGNWHLNLDASAWGAGEHNVVDITEAWAEWRQVPQSAWRQKVKIGAFYAPISLEHRARGWTNPYTISSSALNTWVGEELRTIGASWALEYLGQAAGAAWDSGIELAAFGWNDPAGVVVGLRGFALHDRQTSLGGRVGLVPSVGPAQRVIFHEIDGRAGFHVGGFLRHASGLELRALHYDNRADPTRFDAGIGDYGWRTRFDSLGLRHDTSGGLTLVAQALRGSTEAGDAPSARWDFSTAFILASQQWGRFRPAARFDVFRMDQVRRPYPGRPGRESGHAFTMAGTWSLRPEVDLVAEWLYVDSNNNLRRRIGQTPRAVERSLQLAVRLAFPPP